jgi:hypothetical protein
MLSTTDAMVRALLLVGRLLSCHVFMQGPRQLPRPYAPDGDLPYHAEPMRRFVPPLALVLVVLLAGCVEEARPSDCDADTVEIEVTLTATEMRPSALMACRGQEVTLVVDSEIDAVFHIHGYDEAVPATVIAAGEPARLQFTAEREGQFPIEIHPEDDPRGVEVGIFTVHAS